MTKPPGARRALSWSFANAAMGKLGTLLIGVIIARVLGPEEFGTYAIALVALAAVLSFNELGVSLAIIRWEGDPRRIAPTVTTISVVASLIIFAVGWFVAPAFATAMGDAAAAPVVQLMMVCVPLNGIVAVAVAAMQREYQQGKRTIADQVTTWLGAVLSVVLALAGLGAMSLAISRVIASIVFSIMVLIFSPLPFRFGWDREYIRPLLRFGLPLAGSSIIVFAVGYADQLVVGAVLGAQALGFYLLAFNLASWPVAMLSQPVRAVAPTAFARVQNDPTAMDAGFRAAARVLLAAALPVCAFLAGAALPIITFVYGATWAPAALALQWLALFGAVRIAFELAYDFLAVKRKSAALMAIQLGWLALQVPAVLIGAHLGGIGGVALAQAVVGAVVLVVGYGWVLHSSGVHVAKLGRELGIPVLAGVVAAIGSAVAASLIEIDFFAALVAGVISLGVAAGALALSRRSLGTLNSAGWENA